MATKSPFDQVRERNLERHIENMLFSHPYLIDASLAMPKRQVWLARDSRTDLQCEMSDGSVAIIEIKRGMIKLAAVEQLLRYRKRQKAKGQSFIGFLVGTQLHPDAESRLQRYKKEISFRQLGKDIPTEVVICHQCRRARDSKMGKCPSDGSRQVIV